MTLPPFEEVVRDHGPTVWRVCRALLGPVEADDAWSETFLAALRAYPRLPADSNLEAWLVTVAHRKAIDQHRVRARAPLPVPEPPEPDPAPSDITASIETTVDGDLWDEVRALPFTQRAAVTYHHLVGLPYAEIATILGNSEAAARRAAADGIKTLRTRLTRTTEGVAR